MSTKATYVLVLLGILLIKEPIFFMLNWEDRVGSDICAYKGIEFSSPTLASAFSNLTPAFTFMLAVIFRFSFLLPLSVSSSSFFP